VKHASRAALAVAGALVGVVTLAAPAFAHNEFEPSTATGGTVANIELHAENEQSDAGTTRIDLRFPEGQPLVVPQLPTAAGWTVTLEGGQAGSAVTGILWTRPASAASPDDNPVLPFSIGPLPAAGGRLQFKVLQTYSNGEIDRWIEDWPAGAPEPDMPGPVLDVTSGAAPTSTGAPTSTAPAATTATTAAAGTSDGDDSNAVPIILGISLFLLVAGGTTAFVVLRKRGSA
jgi:periplasmic copper chaperone A